MQFMRLPQFAYRPFSQHLFTLGLAVIVFLAAATPLSAQYQASRTGYRRGVLTATPTSLGFGNVQVGSSETLTATLTNAGLANLTIYNDSTTGTGFTLSGLALPLTLTPGQRYTFTVTFSPSSSNSATGIASFGSKYRRNALNIPLTGTGTTAGQLTVSPASPNFGNVTLGTSSSLSGTLTASGVAVTVSSASGSNSQFVLSGLSFPLTLSAGQTAGFTVAFTPQASGTVSGTLSFLNSAPGSPTIQSLSGTGVSPQHSVSLSWNPSTSVVVGYNLYRSGVTGGPYAKINSAIDPATAYTDSAVVGGAAYYYVTTAVNSSGSESTYSNEVQAIIPTP